MNLKTSPLFLFIFSAILSAQISGIVINSSTLKTVEGVNVTAEEVGTSTDKNGKFQLDVKAGAMLRISHVGYKLTTMPAEDNMIIEMTLKVLQSAEIIVRAGLSEESLQRTASSLTVLTKQDIERTSSDHFQLLTDQIPNLNWAGGTSRPRYFQIRGIGERSHYFGEGPPNFSVGFVLDDMDLSGLGMVGLLYDIDQVEVFKGPQSTIYGPNAMAGLISLRSVKPTDDFNATSSVSLGSDHHHRIGSSFNVPLTKNINFRITGLKNYTDGFRKNISQGVTNSNRRDERLLRAKVGFQTAQNLSVLGTVLMAELKNGYDAWAPDNNVDLRTYSNDDGEDSQLTYGYSLRTSYEASDNLNFTSITSFSETDMVHAYDGDWADSAYWHHHHGFNPVNEGWVYEFFDKNVRNRASLTEEFRFNTGSTTAGFYYKHLHEQDNAAGYLFGGSVTDANSSYDFGALAGYAALSQTVSPKLKLKANIRYEFNEMTYEGNSYGLNANWEKVILPSISFEADHAMIGYKGALQYAPDNITNYFLSISRGYKSGGVNQQPYLADLNRPFEPEFIQNYEVGLKRTTDACRTLLSAFYSQRKNQQVSISSQQDEGDPNSFLFYTANAGSGWIQGLEWEHSRTITHGTQLFTTLGYLDTWVDEFGYQLDTATAGSGGNREAAMSPKVTGSIGMSYHSGFGIFTVVQLTHKGEYYFSDSHDQTSEPYSLMNLTVGKIFQNATIKFWARNMLDVRYTVRGFYFGLIPPDYPDQLWKSYGDPRQIGITLDYNY